MGVSKQENAQLAGASFVDKETLSSVESFALVDFLLALRNVNSLMEINRVLVNLISLMRLHRNDPEYTGRLDDEQLHMVIDEVINELPKEHQTEPLELVAKVKNMISNKSSYSEEEYLELENKLYNLKEVTRPLIVAGTHPDEIRRIRKGR